MKITKIFSVRLNFVKSFFLDTVYLYTLAFWRLTPSLSKTTFYSVLSILFISLSFSLFLSIYIYIFFIRINFDNHLHHLIIIRSFYGISKLDFQEFPICLCNNVFLFSLKCYLYKSKKKK